MKSKILIICVIFAGVLEAKNVLSISEAYRLGLSNANQIKSSVYQYKAMQKRIDQQESYLYPHLSISASINKTYSKTKQSDSIFYKSHRKILTKSISLDFTQVIYDPAQLKRVEVQRKQTELFFIKNAILKQNFATDVLKNYLDAMKSKNRIVLLKSYVDYYRNLHKLIQQQVKMALATEIDLIDIETKLVTAKIQLKKESELLKSYKKSLSYLTGVKNFNLPRGGIKFLSNSKIKRMLNSAKYFLVKSNSLQYKQAKKGIELTQKQIEEAESERLPKINFQANYTKNYSSSEVVYDHTKSLALRLTMPLYDGGLTSAKIEEAKLNRLAAMEDLKKTEKDIDINYEQELANFKALAASVKMYKKIYKKSQLYYKLAKEGYKQNIKSLIDVYEAKTEVNNSKFKYMQNLYDMVTSYVKLLIISNNMDKLSLVDKVVK